MQRQVEEAAGRYRALCEFLPMPLLLLDTAGIIREVNRAFSALMGGDRPHHLGMPLGARIVRGDRGRFRQHLTRSRKGGHAPVSVEVRLSGPDGQPIPVRLVSDVAVHDRVACWTAVLDMRDRRRLEAESAALHDLQRAAKEATEARDLFVAVLSHELRSPLAAVSAAATLLQDKRLELADVPQLAELIARSAAAQARLIDDLFDLSRIARGSLSLKREPTDVHAIASEAFETFAGDIGTKSLSLDVDFRAVDHVVDGDPIRLRQVFWNLVKNAIKFTPSDGCLGLRSWNRAGTIVIEVSDTGVGIEPALLDRVFDRFEQASAGAGGGLGLGLTIARGIVHALGGTISAASAGRDRGSRFLVELPTLAGVPASVLPPWRVARARAPARAACILVVEDDAEFADTLAIALQGAGYQIRCARSVASAQAMNLTGVDLLLSDIDLPDGSGRQLVGWIHERLPIPAIALSGYHTADEAAASREAGFLAHLRKPVELAILQSTIEQALRPPAAVLD